MLHLEIITPEKVVFSAQVKMVTVPGIEGYFGVLEGHEQTISSLHSGVVTTDDDHKFFVSGGFAEVTFARCTILAETATDLKGLSEPEVKAILKDVVVYSSDKH